MTNDNKEMLKITLEDLSAVATPEPGPVISPAKRDPIADPATKSYGNINTVAEAPAMQAEEGSFLLKSWVYLGMAGLLGALTGWGIAEPWFLDGKGREHSGNDWMFPLMVTLMCLGFAVAESIVERSAKKALVRGGLALLLGVILGFILDFITDILYSIGLSICAAAGVHSFHNPATWIVRGIAWMLFGVCGGMIYGIVGQSMKRAGYGMLGGAIGAACGGTLFDPISFLTHGAGASRAIGFALLGLTTGISMGLVESALKDRWLYVIAGPLAGKQFILYRPRTVLGSSQGCDIYLFKDPDILSQHAVLQLKGSRVHLISTGAAYVSGRSVRGARVLESGSVIQLGRRYAFRYQERPR